MILERGFIKIRNELDRKTTVHVTILKKLKIDFKAKIESGLQHFENTYLALIYVSKFCNKNSNRHTLDPSGRTKPKNWVLK